MTSDTSEATGGTYLLVYELTERATLTVGALGSHELPPGGYVYVGSALGSGGFSRIDRHERVAAGTHDVRHWHVDYLGGHDAVRLVETIRLVGRDAECALADRLADRPIEGFGSSDCDCVSHLAAYNDVSSAVSAARDAADAVRQ